MAVYGTIKFDFGSRDPEDKNQCKLDIFLWADPNLYYKVIHGNSQIRDSNDSHFAQKITPKQQNKEPA